MADDTQARAQRVWASLGGLGPAPRMLSWEGFDDELASEQPCAVEYARRQAENDRHNLRMRLIEAALPGIMDYPGSPYTRADLAIQQADAVLARLEVEAKGAAGG